MKSSQCNYPKEECGIVGVFNHPDSANLVYLGLHALQHRGQETSGIVSSDKDVLHRITGFGTVSQVFNEKKMKKLPGSLAIGHNRYSTTGGQFLRNAQPLRAHSGIGPISLAHNGNLINSWEIRDKLEKTGSILQTSIDSEVIVHLMAKAGIDDFFSSLIFALKYIRGAYSLLVMNKTEMYVVRDPNGFRPLVLGEIDTEEGKCYVVASETCAFDIIGAKYIRDVEPGEVLTVSNKGLSSSFPWREGRFNSIWNWGKKQQETLCIFEFVYFSRPDSRIFGQSVYDVRKRLGMILAQEHPVEADVVIPVPDSSMVAALGYAEYSKIPFNVGLVRSHYIGRTFIEPSQKIRDFGAKLKFNAVESVLKDKRVIIVDDSIMRGTTSRKIIKMVRNAGAKEIHMRISSSPTKFPCYYGIDIPTKSELIASNHSLEEIKKHLRVDSIEYLSIEGMLKAGRGDKKKNNWCTACFDGNYPLEFTDSRFSKQKDLFDDYIAND